MAENLQNKSNLALVTKRQGSAKFQIPEKYKDEKNDETKTNEEEIFIRSNYNATNEVCEKLQNIKFFLATHFNFRYNIIKGKIEYKAKKEKEFKEFTDRDENSIRLTLIETDIFKGTISKGLFQSILESNFVPEFHFFKVYFKSLKYDGKDYIQELADTVTVKEGQKERWELYLKKWLIASVATMLEQGTNHTCLTFVGEQGIGKTRWFNRLAINKEYAYCGALNSRDKDSKIMCAETGLINLDELEGTTRGESSYLKSLITLDKINVRRPYGRRNETLARRASFCASVNTPDILGDPTGNRRYLVVDAVKINYNFDDKLIDNVFAQAYYLLKHNEKYWFVGEEIEMINEANKEYSYVCPEEEILQKYFRAPKNDDEACIEKLTATEILGELKDKTTGFNLKIRKLGEMLRKHGYERRSCTDGQKRYSLIRKINDYIV